MNSLGKNIAIGFECGLLLLFIGLLSFLIHRKIGTLGKLKEWKSWSPYKQYHVGILFLSISLLLATGITGICATDARFLLHFDADDEVNEKLCRNGTLFLSMPISLLSCYWFVSYILFCYQRLCGVNEQTREFRFWRWFKISHITALIILCLSLYGSWISFFLHFNVDSAFGYTYLAALAFSGLEAASCTAFCFTKMISLILSTSVTLARAKQAGVADRVYELKKRVFLVLGLAVFLVLCCIAVIIFWSI